MRPQGFDGRKRARGRAIPEARLLARRSTAREIPRGSGLCFAQRARWVGKRLAASRTWGWQPVLRTKRRRMRLARAGLAHVTRQSETKNPAKSKDLRGSGERLAFEAAGMGSRRVAG